MKLIDILACELKEWPQGVKAIEQSDCSTHLYRRNGPVVGRVDTRADDCKTAVVSRSEWQAAVDALKAKNCAVPEWHREGLPPVGTVCEWAGCNFAPEDPKEPDLRIGDQVKIIAHFKDGEFDLAAFTFNPQIHNPDRGTAWVNQGAHGCFRPIRTPEQIEAEAREAAIKEMTHRNDHAALQDWAAYVYDQLGYRKQASND